MSPGEYLPKLCTRTPYPGAPLYFKRLWTPVPDPPPWLIQPIDRPILIYGYCCRSTFKEDYAVEDEAWQASRSFPAICFSQEFSDPEYGFVPLSAVQEVTEGELRAVADAWGVPV